MSMLQSKYHLFDSLEEMLAPETLSSLLSKPVKRVNYEPINEHSGLAGGKFSCVDTDAGQLVLKHMSIKYDWIMFVSDDRLCRSVTLWQYGLLDRLRPQVEHKIIACSHEGDGWAILMDDLSGSTFTWESFSSTPELVSVFLDALARLHATFWNDPNLLDPHLGLCDAHKFFTAFSLPMAQKHQNLLMGVLPEWIRGGWEVMEELLDEDVYTTLRLLTGNPHPLIDALNRYPFTMLHGDYRAENFAYRVSSPPVVIDWQAATHSLMTIDLTWFAKQEYVDDVLGMDGAIHYYRGCLETYLKHQFDDLEWQAMVELGTLVDALRSTCFRAYWYKHVDNLESRQWNEREVKKRNQQVRNALRWL